jgi:pimeloyl-ACP methyl ester carboxylesterase
VKVVRPNERVAGNGDAIAGAAMGPAVKRVRLPDGRRLACRQYGPADGKPVLYMPGTPSCATEWRMWPAGAADQLNMRVVAVDRPGLGGSDPLPRCRIADWPADVTALADALGLSRFAILGYSGGVPYTLSCAEALPDRVSKAALVGCVGPGNIAGMAPAVARSRQMCLHRPRRAWITWWGVRLAARRFPGRLIDQEIGGEQLRGILRLRRAQMETDAAETAARLARVEARLRSIEREGAIPRRRHPHPPCPRWVWLS